jgi:hypothetical protein
MTDPRFVLRQLLKLSSCTFLAVITLATRDFIPSADARQNRINSCIVSRLPATLENSWVPGLLIKNGKPTAFFTVSRSKFDDLGGVDVVARPNRSENFFARSGIEIQNC